MRQKDAETAAEKALAALEEPPFYRGDLCDNGWDAGICDHIAPGAVTACDQPAKYRIEWLHRQELDADSLAISGACERHAPDVDRRQVRRMSSRPLDDISPHPDPFGALGVEL